MTLSDINTKISQLTGVDTTSAGYPSAARLIDINSWQHRILTMIMGSQDESDFDDQRNTTYPDATTPLVDGQRDYSIPVSEKVLAIKRVDISYDGVNYYKAEPIDSNEIPTGIGRFADTAAENKLDGEFSRTSPRYDTKNNAIFVYPRPITGDAAAGGKIRIQWVREMTEITSGELTAGTVVPGFDSAFHPMLAYGPAYDYCFINKLPQAKEIKETLKELEARLIRIYGAKQKDRDINLVGMYQSYK